MIVLGCRSTETLSTRQGPPGLRPVPHRAGALGRPAATKFQDNS